MTTQCVVMAAILHRNDYAKSSYNIIESGLSRRRDGSHHERCVLVWAKRPILDRHTSLNRTYLAQENTLSQ